MSDTNSKFLIKGGNPLSGSVKVSGAKNSATKILVASLLTDEQCFFTNSPNKIKDLCVTIDMCKKCGSKIEIANHTLNVHTKNITSNMIDFELGSSNRIAILLAGPLLHRTGKAEIPVPGGCRIGSRPVNFHIEGLKKLGCNVEIKNDYYVFHYKI